MPEKKVKRSPGLLQRFRFWLIYRLHAIPAEYSMSNPIRIDRILTPKKICYMVSIPEKELAFSYEEADNLKAKYEQLAKEGLINELKPTYEYNTRIGSFQNTITASIIILD